MMAAAIHLLEAHQHDIVYFGVVNLAHDRNIIGAIDVWRCRSCPETFCEDKRYGATELAPEVGFPKLDPGSRWAVLICTREKSSTWTLTGAKPGKTLQHSCTPETSLEFKVGSDYSLETGPASGIGQHRIILLEGFVNTAVDVVTGKRHVGPTNAYLVPGKPFSFAPQHSAAVVEPSRLNILNLTTLPFFLTGVWSALIGASALAAYQTIGEGLRALFLLIAPLSLLGGYLTFKKKNSGPLVGLGIAAAALVSYTSLRLSSGSLWIPDYALAALLLADIAAGWTARAKIKSITGKKWHPLDMPAYG